MDTLFGGSKSSKNLEIILDQPVATFHGDQYEAEPTIVSGRLVLRNKEHMNVRGIKIRLLGNWRVTWAVNEKDDDKKKKTASRLVGNSGTIIDEEQVFFPSQEMATKSRRLAPGKHEWRFQFTLDSDMPETIEGLSGNFVTYNLTAEVVRKMSKDLVATKHLRVIRTLSRDMTETVPLPYDNEETWTDKIRYRIYIPSRYFAFGTSIPVQFTLFPLAKGIKVGKIKMEVLERVELITGQIGDRSHSTTLRDRVVASSEEYVTDEAIGALREESSGVADDSYHFKLQLPLKQSLKSCRQSAETEHIKVHHNMKIYINIHNPDKHVSQICLRNHVSLFISPHTQFANDQVVCNPTTDGSAPNWALREPEYDAPPMYGTHVADQLYDGDSNGPSRIVSGVASPAAFLSRNHSSENLASIRNNILRYSVIDGTGSRTSSMTEATARQLQSRLAALAEQRPATSHLARSPLTSPSHRASLELSSGGPLSRVPSQTTHEPVPTPARHSMFYNFTRRVRRNSSSVNSAAHHGGTFYPPASASSHFAHTIAHPTRNNSQSQSDDDADGQSLEEHHRPNLVRARHSIAAHTPSLYARDNLALSTPSLPIAGSSSSPTSPLGPPRRSQESVRSRIGSMFAPLPLPPNAHHSAPMASYTYTAADGTSTASYSSSSSSQSSSQQPSPIVPASQVEFDFGFANIARAPSYNTALSLPLQAAGPQDADLPTYDSACGMGMVATMRGRGVVI